ncbi:hypothetical protein HG263_09140 [Pseudoalteromonas sp. JBTF-M23]|uniref:Uncharacterized protein n=1 Tax=Pseudoalteromonas caenipelagi TaxID=2726988 RepID=A0A849VAN3_9GAMM|nr:DUF6170 family protein [Pseudoalteromonas caenipelagi]NOU50699.1 hypothetical protein [Pseudoalteromonas caenipelagi]
MNLRLSSVKALDGYKLRDRQQILTLALEALSAPKKVMLRVAKLAVLTPFFIALAYFEGWALLPVLLAAGLSYPLLTTPIEILFAKQTFEQAIEQFKSEQT